MKWPWVSRKRLAKEQAAHLAVLGKTVGTLRAELVAKKQDIQALMVQRDEARKTIKQLEQQVPGINTRKPRFHGPNGIAAQLTAASEEGSLESRQEKAVAAVSQVPQSE